MINTTHGGFCYEAALRSKHNQELLSLTWAENRIPAEGLDAMVSAFFKAGSVPPALYIGLYSGGHVPSGDETAATFLTVATEVTNYEGATRKAFLPGAVASGGCSNATDLAVFSFTGTGTVNGAFISTAAAKGANTGLLMSVVRFPVARPVDDSLYLEVLAGFQLLSM